MTSAIDPTVIGTGNVDKGSVRLQLERARDEISALQTDVATATATIAALKSGTVLWGGTTGGLGNNYTISLTPSITSLSVGFVLAFEVDRTNTGRPFLNIDGLGSSPIQRFDGTDMGVGTFRAGTVVRVIRYSSSEFRLLETPSGMMELGIVEPTGTPSTLELILPTGFSTFQFDLANLSPSANAAIIFQLSLNNGGTFITGATDYTVGWTLSRSPGFIAPTTSSSGIVSLSIAGSSFMRSTVNLTLGATSAVPTYYTATSVGFSNSTSLHDVATSGGSMIATATRPNRIRFVADGTTFRNFGRITMFGIRN
jgi:hypothetical protein